MNGEIWRPIPTFEGVYEVSDLGRVRSLDRKVTNAKGVTQRVRGRLRTVQTNGEGRKFVSLCRDGGMTKHFIDDLIQEAFGTRGVALINEVAEPSGPPIRGAIVRVPFHGDNLLCVENDGKPHVVLKPVIEGLGLDYWAQVRKLRERSWAVTASAAATGADGKTYQMVTADVRTFLMLLATIDEGRVAESVRPKLVAYQAEVADAIESYFTQGGAINPRATEDQLVRLIERRIAMLRSADGLVDRNWLEAKARHQIARALGEEPEVDPGRRPLTVGEFLEDKGVGTEVQRSIRGPFGKRVKSLYRARYDGAEPGVTERFVDGALRDVAGYTERDRDLFEAVWAEIAWTENAS